MNRSFLVLLLLSALMIPTQTMAKEGSPPESQINKDIQLDEQHLSIIKDAQFTAVRLKINRRLKEQKDSIAGINTVMGILKKADIKNKRIRLKLMAPKTEINTQAKSKSFSSWSSSALDSYGFSVDVSISAIIQVEASLDNSEDIYDGAQRIMEFVNSTNLPKNTTINFGDFYLGVRNPEAYAGRLLKLIHSKVQSVKAIFGEGVVVNVPNAKGEVTVIPIDSRRVKLYIPFTLSFKEPICNDGGNAHH